MVFAALQKDKAEKCKAHIRFRKRQKFPLIAVLAGLILSSAIAGCTRLAARPEKINEQADQNIAALTAGLPLAQKVKAKDRAETEKSLTQTKAAGGRYGPAAVSGVRHDYSRIGRASWYGSAFQGKRTANGEIFNMHNLTAAHRTMPLPSYARITNLKNGSSLIVRVNDRGPYVHNRIIDLSQSAAQLLGYYHGGLADVKVDYVGPASLKADDEAFLRASYHPASGAAVKEVDNASSYTPSPHNKTEENLSSLMKPEPENKKTAAASAKMQKPSLSDTENKTAQKQLSADEEKPAVISTALPAEIMQPGFIGPDKIFPADFPSYNAFFAGDK